MRTISSASHSSRTQIGNETATLVQIHQKFLTELKDFGMRDISLAEHRGGIDSATANDIVNGLQGLTLEDKEIKPDLLNLLREYQKALSTEKLSYGYFFTHKQSKSVLDAINETIGRIDELYKDTNDEDFEDITDSARQQPRASVMTGSMRHHVQNLLEENNLQQTSHAVNCSLSNEPQEENLQAQHSDHSNEPIQNIQQSFNPQIAMIRRRRFDQEISSRSRGDRDMSSIFPLNENNNVPGPGIGVSGNRESDDPDNVISQHLTYSRAAGLFQRHAQEVRDRFLNLRMFLPPQPFIPMQSGVNHQELISLLTRNLHGEAISHQIFQPGPFDMDPFLHQHFFAPGFILERPQVPEIPSRYSYLMEQFNNIEDKNKDDALKTLLQKALCHPAFDDRAAERLECVLTLLNGESLFKEHCRKIGLQDGVNCEDRAYIGLSKIFSLLAVHIKLEDGAKPVEVRELFKKNACASILENYNYDVIDRGQENSETLSHLIIKIGEKYPDIDLPLKIEKMMYQPCSRLSKDKWGNTYRDLSPEGETHVNNAASLLKNFMETESCTLPYTEDNEQRIFKFNFEQFLKKTDDPAVNYLLDKWYPMQIAKCEAWKAKIIAISNYYDENRETMSSVAYQDVMKDLQEAVNRLERSVRNHLIEPMLTDPGSEPVAFDYEAWWKTNMKDKSTGELYPIPD